MSETAFPSFMRLEDDDDDDISTLSSKDETQDSALVLRSTLFAGRIGLDSNGNPVPFFSAVAVTLSPGTAPSLPLADTLQGAEEDVDMDIDQSPDKAENPGSSALPTRNAFSASPGKIGAEGLHSSRRPAGTAHRTLPPTRSPFSDTEAAGTAFSETNSALQQREEALNGLIVADSSPIPSLTPGPIRESRSVPNLSSSTTGEQTGRLATHRKVTIVPRNLPNPVLSSSDSAVLSANPLTRVVRVLAGNGKESARGLKQPAVPQASQEVIVVDDDEPTVVSPQRTVTIIGSEQVKVPLSTGQAPSDLLSHRTPLDVAVAPLPQASQESIEPLILQNKRKAEWDSNSLMTTSSGAERRVIPRFSKEETNPARASSSPTRTDNGRVVTVNKKVDHDGATETVARGSPQPQLTESLVSGSSRAASTGARGRDERRLGGGIPLVRGRDERQLTVNLDWSRSRRSPVPGSDLEGVPGPGPDSRNYQPPTSAIPRYDTSDAPRDTRHASNLFGASDAFPGFSHPWTGPPLPVGLSSGTDLGYVGGTGWMGAVHGGPGPMNLGLGDWQPPPPIAPPPLIPPPPPSEGKKMPAAKAEKQGTAVSQTFKTSVAFLNAKYTLKADRRKERKKAVNGLCPKVKQKGGCPQEGYCTRSHHSELVELLKKEELELKRKSKVKQDRRESLASSSGTGASAGVATVASKYEPHGRVPFAAPNEPAERDKKRQIESNSVDAGFLGARPQDSLPVLNGGLRPSSQKPPSRLPVSYASTVFR
ncbi:hypothetical protein HDU93_002493 [Gonapodya sp. JEL0774]|nr:hypothetical protein HDU93_002493 [Gonapodya sp. JEL0774]